MAHPGTQGPGSRATLSIQGGALRCGRHHAGRVSDFGTPERGKQGILQLVERQPTICFATKIVFLNKILPSIKGHLIKGHFITQIQKNIISE